MKTCPVCDKTFEDSMRFCQTDGTPLVDAVDEPVDPFKTMVAPKEDLGAIPPPDDPFKTVVAGSGSKEDSGDLLQLPADDDPMKTSVVSAGELPELEREEDVVDVAPSPFEESPAVPSPFEESKAAPPSSPFDESKDSPFSTPPEPPKFEEPSLSPPSFGDLSGERDSQFTEGATEIIPPESLPKIDPFSSEPPKQDFTPPPVPSPFDEAPPSSYEKPSAPPYREPEPPPTVMGTTPFDQPGSYGQQGQFNQPSQQGEWTPPPAPVANWQDQGLGANTPFQPPVVGQGQNNTLAVVSLVCGILSICLCGIFTGIPAIITGFMAKNNVDANPELYGGRGMALAGMIMGFVSIVFTILYVIFMIATGGRGF